MTKIRAHNTKRHALDWIATQDIFLHDPPPLFQHWTRKLSISQRKALIPCHPSPCTSGFARLHENEKTARTDQRSATVDCWNYCRRKNVKLPTIRNHTSGKGCRLWSITLDRRVDKFCTSCSEKIITARMCVLCYMALAYTGI